MRSGRLVGAVVDAVVRRGVERVLERRRQLLDALGVNPKLLDQADRLRGDGLQGAKPSTPASPRTAARSGRPVWRSAVERL